MVEKTQETRVTTETVDLYVCPSCEQGYEKDEMVNVGLGAVKSKGESTASFEEISMMCENCTNSIFKYQGEKGSIPDTYISELDRKEKSESNIHNIWASIIAVGAMIHFLGWAMAISSGGDMTRLVFFTILVSWIAIPIATFLDLQQIFSKSEWDSKWGYLYGIGSIIWIINLFVVLIYFGVRYKKLQSQS